MEQSTSITISAAWPYLSFFGSMALAFIVSFCTSWAKLAKYQQKVDDLVAEKNNIIYEIKLLRTDADTLKEFKINAQKFIDRALYQQNSPLTLTELGHTLLKESGFMEIFDAEKNNLSRMLAEMNPLTRYDTQEMARALMDDLQEYPPFLPLKSYGYNTGKDFGQILRAGAIPLRDYYLSTHPEMVK
ncbi:MAG: hypothetical protein ACYC0J_09510 [Gammaproteobacteria bacterium]